MKISIIGQGYVGLPLSLAAVGAKHHVTGIDLSDFKVQSITNRNSYVDDISDQQIADAIDSGYFKIESTFSSLESSEIIVVCVPTPIDASSKPDFSHLESAINSIAKNLLDGKLIIIESTVAPGTTRDLVNSILLKTNVGFELAYSPERIDPSNRFWTIKNTPKLVAGITDGAAQRALRFYESFVDSVILCQSVEVIETAKLLENSFRFINISFINEIAEFCSKMNIDVRQVIAAAATKPFGFMPFFPSAGVGGHCIPVDPLYLAEKAKNIGTPTRFIDLANSVNKSRAHFFTKLAEDFLGNLVNKRILIVGIAYKPDVSDARETPAKGLIDNLRILGAKVLWHDNLVSEWNNEKSTDLSEGYDLAILVNPHFNTQLSKLGSTPILDTKGGNL